MEDALSRQEYPAMLERLQPGTAVGKLNERVKDIGKVNYEIADWIQERCTLEKTYAQGLRKLAKRPLRDVNGQLGVFEAPWKRIIAAVENIAKSHSNFAERIEIDVEHALRGFQSTNREMAGMTTIQGNLAAMAKELEEAQDRSEKLIRKGGKASAQKVDTASNKLQSAQQQWDSQAPFIFETLQALDERRLNHLRDVLTQYETYEADRIERDRKTVEETLSSLLDVDTAKETKNWAAANIAGKPVLERSARQPSITGSTATSSTAHPPQTAGSGHTDNQSEHSHPSHKEKESGESKLKSRFGTMLGRRRQSIQGTFNRAPSPSKGFQPFGRSSSSRDGRPIPSPRASSTNLRESPSRQGGLESLAESPPSLSPTAQTNGNALNAAFPGGLPQRRSSLAPPSNDPTTPDLSDVQPPPGPPPSHVNAEPQKDSEGFTLPGVMNDPISQAEHEATQGDDQPQFKLDIRKDPIPEQDADAQAALSNVANTLRSAQIPAPNRKSGTVRGRRDVRNTVYMPSNSLDVVTSESAIPPSPGIATGRAAALANLSGESSHLTGSDTTSIRSGHSLSNSAITRHADMHAPGLNASIVESMSASFENGVPVTMEIKGEIALIHNKAADDSSNSSHETIRIDNFPNLEVIGPNRTFIHPVPGDKTDEYTIDLSPISAKSGVAFTYRGHVDTTNLSIPAPLMMKPAWKIATGFLGLIIDYSLNATYSTTPITVKNLIIRAIYQGSKASAAQLKPSGVHVKDQSLVYWKLGDVVLGPESQRVVCRFMAKDEAVPEPGHIEARWEIQGGKDTVLGSGIGVSKLEIAKAKEESDDPFADETIASPSVAGTWVEVETHKKFVSAKYEVK